MTTQATNEALILGPHLALESMRDNGYKNTAYALAELIDNSIQAEATLVEVFCIEEFELAKDGERHRWRVSNIAVLDNGSGMDAITLKRHTFNRERKASDPAGASCSASIASANSVSKSCTCGRAAVATAAALPAAASTTPCRPSWGA